MRIKTASLLAAAAFAAASAGLAQTSAPAKPAPAATGTRPAAPPATKVTGTLECGKGARNVVEVGDTAGHAIASGKSPCTWSKPMTIEGLATKEGSSAALSDIRGDVSIDHGYHVGTVVTGDKYFVRFDGKSESSKGVVQSQVGRWGFTGGTGKLTGLQGRGSYKSTGKPDGSTTVEIEGEYRIVPASATPAAPAPGGPAAGAPPK